MPIVRQTSFAGGEISPTLYGRSDLEKCAVSLKRMRNFFASRQGAAVSRPGTTYVGPVKNSSAGKVRLIPFVYSDTVSFVLEFGNQYVRVWSNGLYQGEVSSGGTWSVAIPYVTADLPTLKYAQTGAVLTLAHPNYAPAELSWTGSAWAYAAIAWDRPVSAGGGAFLVEPLQTASNASTYVAATAYNQGAQVSANGQTYVSLAGSNAGHNLNDTNWWLPIPLSTEPPKEWVYKITELWLDSRGNAYEKAPFAVAKMGVPFYQPFDSRITYVGGAHGVGTQVTSNGTDTATGIGDGGAAGTTYRCIATNKGNLLSNATYWTADNVAVSPTPVQYDSLPATFCVYPDKPVVINFWSGYANALTDPNFLGFRIYRGRGSLLGWIGDAKPTAGLSFTDDGTTPDYARTPPMGTNPFKFYNASGALTSTEYPSCVAFFEERRCFARTNNRPGFIWTSVTGDYANFDTHVLQTADDSLQFEIASRKREDIRALVPVGPKLLAFTNSAVWAIGGNGGPLAFDNIDAKRQGEVGSNWVEPLVVDGVALFVRTKGTGIRSLTEDFVRQSYVGFDLSIMASHLFVGHQIVDWCHAEDPWSLVWAIRDDGLLLSLTYVKDHDLWAWAWHDSPGGTTPGATGGGLFESVCCVPEGQEDAVYFVVNRTLNGTVARYIERLSTRVVTAANGSQLVALDCATIYNGSPTTSMVVNGLAGQSVYVLQDGVVDGPFTVDANAGTITLNNPGSYVIAGLMYTPELQLLDVALGGAEVKTIDKQVSRVGFEVDSSRGLMAGPDFNDLTEWTQRQVSDGFNAVGLSSSLVRQYVLGNWGTDGDACLRQTQPLPVTVISVAREVQLGDV